jgi:hypothetical protein
MARKKKAQPTVTRGEDGKIVSLKPQPGPTSGLPSFVGQKPVTETTTSKPKRVRKKTRSGKKLVDGKIRTPKVGELASKGDGLVTRTTPENVEELSKIARTTELPTADRVAMGGETPTMRPVGKPTVIRGGITAPKGLAGGTYEHIADKVAEARGHLANMTLTRGKDEFHTHHEAFNVVHAEIGQIAPDIHKSLSVAHHLTMNPGSPIEHHEAVDRLINERLSIYKSANSSNVKKARAGYAARMEIIRAGREGSQ